MKLNGLHIQKEEKIEIFLFPVNNEANIADIHKKMLRFKVFHFRVIFGQQIQHNLLIKLNHFFCFSYSLSYIAIPELHSF